MYSLVIEALHSDNVNKQERFQTHRYTHIHTERYLKRQRDRRNLHFEEAEVVIGCDCNYFSSLNKVVESSHCIHKREVR